MDTSVIDFKKRFDLDGTVSLKQQIEDFFGEKALRIMTQIGLFPGFDEVAVLLKSGLVFRCLSSDGKQVSDWMQVEKEAQR